MGDQVQRAVLLHLPGSNKVDIKFDNIGLTVSQGRKEKRRVLNGVSGKFKSGELTAIMGPSGAGKTTLLNILTGFQCVGMTGIITSTGNTKNKKGSEQYKKESCYILQDDQLFPSFTVLEIMSISADLKLGYGLSQKSKQLIIDDILDILVLSSCKHVKCGRLSGGQKKRLSIALELIINPQVMFLDEPTTGLDSLSTLQCIRILKALARGGRTIICTIHQPSAVIYEMFDHVYVIAEGACIYQGASINTVPYLSSVGLHCPEYHNPADYLLEVASGEYGNFTEELAITAVSKNWRSTYTAPSLGIQEEITMQKNESIIDHNKSKLVILHTPPSEWSKLSILLYRFFLQLYKDWIETTIKLVLHIIVGVLIGLIFLNAGNDASKTISNFSYLLVTSLYLCYTSMMPAVLKFPSEMPVLRKERFNNWYQLKTYYVAYIMGAIPVQIIYCSCYTCVSYYISAQPLEWPRFLMFLVACCLIVITAESIGLLLGTIFNPVNGTFVGSISIALTITLAGFFVFLSHMSKLFYILSFTSYLRYGLQGLVYAIYGHGRGTIPCPDDAVYCHYTTPPTFLKEIGMANINYWFSIGTLGAVIIFFKLLAYSTLKRRLSGR